MIERQVRRADRALLPTPAHSFVACGRAEVPHAPACKEWWWKTLCPGVDTHTQSKHDCVFSPDKRNETAKACDSKALGSARIHPVTPALFQCAQAKPRGISISPLRHLDLYSIATCFARRALVTGPHLFQVLRFQRHGQRNAWLVLRRFRLFWPPPNKHCSTMLDYKGVRLPNTRSTNSLNGL